MSHSTAAALTARFLALSAQVERSLRTVMSHETLGTAKDYGALAGRLLGYAYTNILAPLWRAFPDLQPLTEASGSASHTLSQESITQIVATIELARRELAHLRSDMTASSNTIPADITEASLTEIEGVLVEIEAFLLSHASRPDTPA